MKEFNVLLKKEWWEQTRNFKVLWIPLFFIIFGIIEPVSNYYLPEIMKSVGNMPEGSEFLWPEYTGEEIFMSLLGQYQTIGTLVIVLAFMGAISGERKAGTATLLYVRPISFYNYFLSKWVMVNAIVLVSVWLGFLAAWYYITILFNNVAPTEVFQFMGVYSIWIIFVVTIILTLSASFSTSIAASIGILLTFVLQIVDAMIGTYWTLSPWKIPTYATYAFQDNDGLSNLWWSAGITIFLIMILVLLGGFMSKYNTAKTTV